MSITIKEIIVKTTVNRSKNESSFSQEDIRKLKQEIIREILKIQEKKAEWEKEW